MKYSDARTATLIRTEAATEGKVLKNDFTVNSQSSRAMQNAVACGLP